MLRGFLIAFLLLALVAPAFAAGPADDSGTINIMKPEPGTAPAKHRRARKPPHQRETDTAAPKGFGVKQDTKHGSSNPIYPTPLPGPQVPLPVPHREAVTPRGQDVPPALLVPQTGRVLPNLAAPGATETMQDKSVRCAHQAGVYGPANTGDPGSYIRSCINQ